MRKRRTFLKRIGALGTIGLLAGCSTGSGATTEQSTPTATDTAAPNTPTGGTGETDGTPTATDTAAPSTPTPEPEPAVTFGGNDEINMSLSPSVPQSSLYVQYAPIRDYLENYVEQHYDVPEALDANMNIGSNYAAVIQALGQGTADWAETGPFAAAMGVKTGNADVILQRKGYGSWKYTGQIAAAPDSDIQSLADLAGKKVAFSDPLSTSGFLYPLYHMQTDGGLDIGNLPSGNGSQANFDPIFAGGHVKSYSLLKSGQVDAACTGSFVPGIVDNYDKHARVLTKTDKIPRAPIVVSATLSDRAKDALQQAFLDAPDRIYLGANGKKGGDDDLWFSAVREASVDTYKPVIEKANSLGIGTDFFKS